MKKLLIILGTVLISTVSLKSQEISFEKEKINYGTIESGSNGYRDIVFTNIGKDPLIITSVVGVCGCTTTIEDGKPGWPTDPILFQEKGVIKVKYDTKREGKFAKIITIHSNNLSGDKQVLIYGEVLPKKN